MDKDTLFHPRQYPVSLSLLWGVMTIFLIFHFTYQIPLQEQLGRAEIDWRAGRETISVLDQIENTENELRSFREILPSREGFPEIITMLSKLAKQHSLTIPEINYESQEIENQKLTEVDFAFGVLGKYEDIRTFIQSLELSRQFFLIEDLGLLKPGTKINDPILLQMQVAVYLTEVDDGVGRISP